jgi:outer membrane protein TolC
MQGLKQKATIKRDILLFLVVLLGIPSGLFGQNTLEQFLDSALTRNPEAAAIQSQIHSIQFDNQMISAVMQAPKASISSELLVAPYLNNGGQLIDTEPSAKAIGYDVGITNGGLYSLLFNLELPLLKGRQVTHLQEQNQLEVNRLKSRLDMIENELKRTIGNLYFEALALQVSVDNNRRNSELLNEEFQLIKSLTRKGLYRISDYKLMELELKSDSIGLSTSISDYEFALRQLKSACGIRQEDVSRLSATTLEMSRALQSPSLFVSTFALDSLSAIAQQQVSNDRYLPQLNVYFNSGLNSTSIPLLERHIGASAGIQLTYNLFDGHQKKINEQQQLLSINNATLQKQLKLHEIKSQAEASFQNIQNTRAELLKQKKLQGEYADLLKIYQEEVGSAQISVIDLIAFLKKYSEINRNVSIREIMLNKMINEYNYWNR